MACLLVSNILIFLFIQFRYQGSGKCKFYECWKCDFDDRIDIWTSMCFWQQQAVHREAFTHTSRFCVHLSTLVSVCSLSRVLAHFRCMHSHTFAEVLAYFSFLLNYCHTFSHFFIFSLCLPSFRSLFHIFSAYSKLELLLLTLSTQN